MRTIRTFWKLLSLDSTGIQKTQCSWAIVIIRRAEQFPLGHLRGPVWPYGQTRGGPHFPPGAEAGPGVPPLPSFEGVATSLFICPENTLVFSLFGMQGER